MEQADDSGGGDLLMDVLSPTTMTTTLDRSTDCRGAAANISGGGGGEGGGGGLSIEFGSRFVPYTAVSACSVLLNGAALAVLVGFVRGPRTVHQRLLANLTVGDVLGTVLLWLYNNSPYIFPRFQVTRHKVNIHARAPAFNGLLPGLPG